MADETVTARACAEVEQLSGELACLLAMAYELSQLADDESCTRATWKLRALLRAMWQHADTLHDACGDLLLSNGA